MAAFDKKIPGQSFRPYAEEYNGFIDAARNAKNGQAVVSGPALSDPRRLTTAKVRNCSGVVLDRGDAVALRAPIITPADSEPEFLRQLTFDAYISEAADLAASPQRVGVLLVPLGIGPTGDETNGAIGDCAVSGMVQCRVDIQTEADRWASLTEGEAHLASHPTCGDAEIVWPEIGTGEQWAIVRLGRGTPCDEEEGSGSGSGDGSGSGSGDDIPPGCGIVVVTNTCVIDGGSGSGCCPIIKVEKTRYNTCTNPWTVLDRWCEENPGAANCCPEDSPPPDEPSGPTDEGAHCDTAIEVTLGSYATPLLNGHEDCTAPALACLKIYKFAPEITGIYHFIVAAPLGTVAEPAGNRRVGLFGSCTVEGDDDHLALPTAAGWDNDSNTPDPGLSDCGSAALTAGKTYFFLLLNGNATTPDWSTFTIGVGPCP